MKFRRTFLKAVGFGVAAAAFLGIGSASVSFAGEKECGYDFSLGIASYSFREFSTEQALDMAQRAGMDRITFKSMHLPLDSDAETIEETVALCEEKGITLYGGGVITMKTKEDVDQAFEYAKAAGMEMIIGVPYPAVLEYVEEKVIEYDIKMAIHNHGPGDDLYPSAPGAYEKIQGMDRRMGLCLDIGHTTRINRDPEQDLTDCFGRVFDIHIKDVTAAEAEGTTCSIGHGVIDIVSFLETAIDLGYAGTLSFEYESDKEDPLPGMMESIGFVRGVLATM